MSRGRNRKICRRQPNGQPSRPIADRGTAIPPEALDQRARIVGADFSRDERAGTAIGRLLLTGHIRRHHYEAGLLLYRAWGSWQRMAELPPRSPKAGALGNGHGDVQRPDVAPDEWARAAARYRGAMESVRSAAGYFSWTVIDSLVIDDQAYPRAFEGGQIGQQVMVGLDALADFFRVPVVKGDEEERVA